jgi:hypothetical protein
MARLTAAEMTEKWSRRVKAAGTDMAAGINRVTEAPGVAAARQSNVMLANLQARVSDGTWGRRVSGVSLQDWKDAAIKKGVQRVAAGVDGSMSKTQQVFGDVLAAVDAAVAEVNRTPRGDINTNIQRAVTFMQAMARNAPTRK